MTTSQLHILFIEDSPADADLLQEILDERGNNHWQLHHVDYLEAALQCLQTTTFDVILSDLSLPDAQGVSTIQQIQAIAPLIPLIVLTGLDDGGMGLEALRLGAQDYLVKGQINYHLLTRSVQYAIERCKNQAVMRQQSIAMSASREGIALLNEANEFTYVNFAYAEMYGWLSTQDLLGKNWCDLYREKEQQCFLEAIFLELQQQGYWSGETRGYRCSGEIFYQELSLTQLPEGGMVCIVRDISDRKRTEAERRRAEQELRASLAEKELLFKEVHHRVKNNLQVISSIFSLQSQYLSDPRILATLEDSRNRIYSMALIHEQLYRSSNLTQINFNEYIQSLIQNLFDSYNINSNQIEIALNISGVVLTVDTAIPCGLLINELLSNALKHAFPENRQGKIQIDFWLKDTTHLQLTVRDNGIGLPPTLDLKQTNSLGLRLVRALTRQLSGKMEAFTDQGAVFQVCFPKPQIAASPVTSGALS